MLHGFGIQLSHRLDLSSVRNVIEQHIKNLDRTLRNLRWVACWPKFRNAWTNNFRHHEFLDDFLHKFLLRIFYVVISFGSFFNSILKFVRFETPTHRIKEALAFFGEDFYEFFILADVHPQFFLMVIDTYFILCSPQNKVSFWSSFVWYYALLAQISIPKWNRFTNLVLRNRWNLNQRC